MRATLCHPAFSFGLIPHGFPNGVLSAVVIIKARLVFKPGSPAMLAEEPAEFHGDVHQDDDLTKPLLLATDLAPSKPRADILLSPTAFAPGGQPSPQIQVAVRVGGLRKSLTVFGPRTWKKGVFGTSGTNPPQPVASAPVAYALAMGGEGTKRNPVGMGYTGDDAPRIEYTGQPLTKPQDADPPGFAPLPFAWPQRSNRLGTYDSRWQKERWPWLPADFDYSFFNAAPRDQQIDGYLKGDEEVELTNLHPEVANLKTRLPGFRLRLFVTVGLSAPHDFREVPAVLDTMWIDPIAGALELTWRGSVPVRNVKMREIDGVHCWTEPLSEKPRPIGEYRLRIGETDEVEPAAVPAAPAEPEQPDEMDGLMTKLQAELDAAVKQLAQLEAVAVAEATQAMQMAGMTAPPPAAPMSAGDSMRQSIASLESLPAAQKAELQTAAGQFDQLEKEAAQFEADAAAESPGDWTRDSVAQAAREKKSLANEDLTGLDLSKLDLSGIDLSGARLKACNLTEANLSAARLVGTAFIKSTLDGANLTGANLERADLSGSTFKKTNWTAVRLVEARLTRLDLSGADLSAVDASTADFSESNLAGAKLIGATLHRTDFTQCNIERVDFRSADLTRACLDTVAGTKANFDQAIMNHAAVGRGAVLAEAIFRGVAAERAAFDTAVLERSDWSRSRTPYIQLGECRLAGALFDRCDLTGATFDDSDLRKAQLTRSNLLRVSFERADLTDASIAGSNAYEAGFWQAIVDRLNRQSANLRGTLLG